jgi:threonine synthase
VLWSRHIGPSTGLNRLGFKLESSNPTGSYKDRFAASAVSHMRASQQSLCVATSSGNSGAALAAYCAAARIACRIAIVETTPNSKLLQMLAYGAELYRVTGFGTDPAVTASVFTTLADVANGGRSSLQISAFKYSPLGMNGVQSIAYEIAQEEEQVRHVFVPVGGGGLALAIARGFEQLRRGAPRNQVPAVHCVQPEGNDTIAGPLMKGDVCARSVSCTTAISGLQVPSVVDGDQAIKACRSSGGSGFTVTDGEIYDAQQRLAREEGIYCEPAGAVSVAAVLRAAREGRITKDDITISLITGTGFKDLAAAEKLTSGSQCQTIDPTEVFQRFSA